MENDLQGQDVFSVSSRKNLPSGGFNPGTINLRIVDPSAQLVDSFDLPVAPLDLTRIDAANRTMEFQPLGGVTHDVLVRAQVDRMSLPTRK